jgi:hypothetical protein
MAAAACVARELGEAGFALQALPVAVLYEHMAAVVLRSTFHTAAARLLKVRLSPPWELVWAEEQVWQAQLLAATGQLSGSLAVLLSVYAGAALPHDGPLAVPAAAPAAEAGSSLALSLSLSSGAESAWCAAGKGKPAAKPAAPAPAGKAAAPPAAAAAPLLYGHLGLGDPTQRPAIDALCTLEMVRQTGMTRSVAGLTEGAECGDRGGAGAGAGADGGARTLTAAHRAGHCRAGGPCADPCPRCRRCCCCYPRRTGRQGTRKARRHPRKGTES